MRYTAEAIMDEKGLRDVERWKDKIEVRLDNRQVAFLFFGSALVACLLFILGVIVGKRIESRGHAVAPEIEDPLALLDRVAATERPGSDGLNLPKTLLALPARTKAAAPAAPVVAPAAAKKVAAPVAAPLAQVAAAPPAVKEAPKEIAKEPAKKPPVVVAPVVVAAPVAVTPPPTAAKSKGHYSLQIRAFPERGEADAFSRKLGPGSYVVPAEIPGKGMWYRVRLGDYATYKDAVSAKGTFEKQHSMIGLVVGPF